MFHHWMNDDENYVSCLICGALAEDTEPGSFSADIVGSDGERIRGCSSDTTQCHHYSGECVKDSGCNLLPDCNCYYCH